MNFFKPQIQEDRIYCKLIEEIEVGWCPLSSQHYSVILEDDLSTVDLIKKVSGMNCVHFKTNSSLLKSYKKLSPKIAFFDINLSNQEKCFEILPLIRSYWNCPILVMSSSTHPNDIESIFKLGADDFLRKPFILEELHQRIQKFTQNRSPDSADFGAIQFDFKKLHLEVEGIIYPQSRHALSTLNYLFNHKNQVVDSNDILAEVWPNKKVSVNNLQKVISQLKAFSEKHKLPFSLVTHYGKGYELVTENPKAEQGEKILICDDSPLARDFLEKSFLKLGQEISKASNVKDATDLISSQTIKYVFVDSRLLESTWDDFLQHCEKNYPDLDLTFVLMTKNAQNYEHPFILKKPFNHESLMEILKKLEIIQTTPQQCERFPDSEFDRSTINDLTQLSNDERFLENLFDLFIEQSEETMTHLKSSQQADEAFYYIHKIKGLSANIGAKKLYALSKEFERTYIEKNHELSDIEIVSFRRLDNEYQQLKTVLKNIFYPQPKIHSKTV